MEPLNQANSTTQQSFIPANNSCPEITFKEWMITFLMTGIPIAGLLFLFMWAFSPETNPTKANWAKASLLWMAIIAGIWIFFSIIAIAIVGGSINELMKL